MILNFLNVLLEVLIFNTCFLLTHVVSAVTILMRSKDRCLVEHLLIHFLQCDFNLFVKFQDPV